MKPAKVYTDIKIVRHIKGGTSMGTITGDGIDIPGEIPYFLVKVSIYDAIHLATRFIMTDAAEHWIQVTPATNPSNCTFFPIDRHFDWQDDPEYKEHIREVIRLFCDGKLP